MTAPYHFYATYLLFGVWIDMMFRKSI